MAVPLLNLTVQQIDRFVTYVRTDPRWMRLRLDWIAARPNLAHMGVWILFFVAMTMLGRTDARHTGDSLPFWEEACEEGRRNACGRLLLLETTYCADSSGWACNEVGRHYMLGSIVPADPELAMGYFSRGCELRFQAACLNVLEPESALSSVPRAFDLRLLLREGGLNLMDTSDPELYERACDHEWAFACARVAGSL
jgi:hypothetical protein